MKGKIIWKGAMLALVIIFAVSVFVAADADNETALKGQALDIRYNNLQCQVDFTTQQMDLVVKDIPQAANFTVSQTQLQSDLTQLKTYANSGDKTSFDSYVTTTLKSDMGQANDQLRDIKKKWRSYNLTNDTMTDFLQGFKTDNQGYVNCLNDKEIKMAQVLQQYYQNSDDNWKKSIANFASKNLSTDEMNSVEQELASKVSQLQAAINAGNTSVMRDTMKNISDENLHLWANFDTAMIKSHINKLRDIASQYNVSANLDDLDNSLNSLSTYTAPGYKYTQSDLEKVWSTLRDDSGELKNVSMNILEMRRTEMQNRKQNMMNRTQGRGMMNRTQGKGMFNRTGQQENNNGSGGQ